MNFSCGGVSAARFCLEDTCVRIFFFLMGVDREYSKWRSDGLMLGGGVPRLFGEGSSIMADTGSASRMGCYAWYEACESWVALTL